MPSRGLRNEGFEVLVGVVLRVAQLHGASVALADLAQLLPPDTTSEDLALAFESHPGLRRYALKDGFVVERVAVGPPTSEYGERQQKSLDNIREAKWLSTKLGARDPVMVAVSGSTSYLAASQKDDVDLFCVTRPWAMWFFLTKALLLTRTSRLLKKSNAPICLSCVMDERYATNLFSADRGALFARDTLVAEVVLGRDRYDSLLKSAPWIKRYFPKLYGLRSSSPSPRTGGNTEPSNWAKFVNLFLFATVGTYIRAKARLHNHLLSREGKDLSLFHARVGRDHLIYESAKYLRLRDIYNEIQPMEEGYHGQTERIELLETTPRASEAR